MTTPLDDGIETLQAFCELLAATNPVLESGAADLQRLAHSLSDSESRLSLDLDTLATEVDGLQKEAETTQAAAEKACVELGEAAEDAKGTGLANLEKEAVTVGDHWSQAVQQKMSPLGSALQDLTGAGWEPLGAALASEGAAFERWTQASDAALGNLVHLFNSVATDVEHDAAEAAAAAHDLAGAPAFEHAFWQEPESQAEKVTEETIPWFRNQEVEVGQEQVSTHEHLVAAAGDDSSHVRGQMDLTAHKAAEAIDAQANEVTQALQETEEALMRGQTEFERSAVQADHAETRAQGLSELAGQVAEAEAKLQRIRAAVEAMEQ